MITATRVAAAHDGIAELVVTLLHTGGGCSEVMLDEMAASALLRSCAASHPSSGRTAVPCGTGSMSVTSWRRILHSL